MFDGAPGTAGCPGFQAEAKISNVQFTMAGRSIGSVTRVITRHGPAPALRAASSSEESVLRARLNRQVHDGDGDDGPEQRHARDGRQVPHRQMQVLADTWVR